MTFEFDGETPQDGAVRALTIIQIFALVRVEHLLAVFGVVVFSQSFFEIEHFLDVFVGWCRAIEDQSFAIAEIPVFK